MSMSGNRSGSTLRDAIETIQPTFPNSALTVRQRALYSSSMGRLSAPLLFPRGARVGARLFYRRPWRGLEAPK
jgi:hypothetical protein